MTTSIDREVLLAQTNAYFSETVGLDLNALLAPIAASTPAGEWLRGGARYRSIRQARQEDDPNLPLGAWQRELKKADWPAVAHSAAQALATESKDLQLFAWLFEAQLQRSGVLAVQPCALLLEELLNLYWEIIYPLPDDQAMEHRINLLAWMDDKLTPLLRRVPLTATGSGQELSWADWEQALRNEQLKANLGTKSTELVDALMPADFSAALGMSPTLKLVQVLQAFQQAIACLQHVVQVLGGYLADDAPSFSLMRHLCERIVALLSGELDKRAGERPFDPAPNFPTVNAQDHPGTDPMYEHSATAMPEIAALSNREEAYRALSAVANYLAKIEPHSPVPHLIHRAVQWGSMNTADLYREVFVRGGGQINIFEMLGIALEESSS